MYGKKNIITVGLLWLALLVIGIVWHNKESKNLNQLQTKNKQLKNQLDGSLAIAKTLEATESQYRVLNDRWSNAPKQIIATDEPSFSLYYLNWLVNNYKIPVEFDFELKNITNNPDILTFGFLLSGEGTYQDLYRLIWFITENPILYQIESFNLKQSRNANNLLEFSMLIKGFSSLQELDSGQEFSFDTMRPAFEQIQFHDAFKPLNRIEQPRQTATVFRREIPKVKPKLVDPGLVNIEAATLQAVANGRVYIKDNKGKLITLKVGDKVSNGNLKNINQKKSEVEFVLNKDGFMKTVILGLDYKK